MVKVTIFGLAGTGTTTVGKMLAARLGAPFMSAGQIFRAKAAQLHFSLYEFETLCGKDSSYDKALDEELSRYGKEHEHFVLESRLGWYFVPDSFKVKITCDFDTRIARIAKRDNEEMQEKREKTLYREAAGPARYREYYGITDFAPDSVFDIVCDSTGTTPEELTQNIVDSLQERGRM